MSFLKIKCFFGFHKDCFKLYTQMYEERPKGAGPRYKRLSYVKVFCDASKKYIRTEHREDTIGVGII